MSENEKNEDLFDRLTSWMGDVESMDLQELRNVRKIMGDDVELSEQRFLVALKDLQSGLAVSEATAEPLVSLISRAREHGFNAMSLADQTGLSVALVTKMDRRLLLFNSIPDKVISILADALESTQAVIAGYFQQPQSLAMGAHYRADESPRVPEQQDFFDAVRSDVSISEERRSALLALEQPDKS
jgi:hypothetical protein